MALILIATCWTTAHAQHIKRSYKADNIMNPILPYNLCADPTAVEHNGRLYVYGTNDQQEYDTTNDSTRNTYGKITQLVCMSTDDLVNWTFHGEIDVKAAAPWIWTSWAPSIVSRKEDDGETHFYLYFTNSAAGIGVLTSTSPTGPWHDPIGHALIDWTTQGRGEQSNIIDPGVCIDDKGNAWLAFGGGDPNKYGSTLMPGNARIVRLGKDMISLDGKIHSIPAPFHFEANELNFENGHLIFSYSGSWGVKDEEWIKYQGRGTHPCPGACSILGMTTTDPESGAWTYTGEILRNPGTYGYRWGNNHSHIQYYSGRHHILYHTQRLEEMMGLDGGYRSICIDNISLDTKTPRFPLAKMTDTGAASLVWKTPRATDSMTFEAEMTANSAGAKFRETSGAMAMADIEPGGWTLVKDMAFQSGAKSIRARLTGTGSLEVRTSLSAASSFIARIDFNTPEWHDYTVNLSSEIQPGSSFPTLYFLFTKASDQAAFDNYQFFSRTADEVSAINPPVMTNGHTDKTLQTIYDIYGRKASGMVQNGVYIVGGKKIVVSHAR